jgi:hypothetical protein
LATFLICLSRSSISLACSAILLDSAVSYFGLGALLMSSAAVSTNRIASSYATASEYTRSTSSPKPRYRLQDTALMILRIEDLIKTTRGEMLIAEFRNRLRQVAVGTRTLALGVRKMVETATAAASQSVTNDRRSEPEPVEPDSPSPELPADLPSSTDTAKEALAIAARERKAERAKRKAAKADATDAPSVADEPVPTEQTQPLAVAAQQADGRASA